MNPASGRGFSQFLTFRQRTSRATIRTCTQNCYFELAQADDASYSNRVDSSINAAGFRQGGVAVKLRTFAASSGSLFSQTESQAQGERTLDVGDSQNSGATADHNSLS